MNERQTFVLAERALRAVVEQIDADQWDQIVPDAWVRHPDATLRDVVNYHAYDDAWVPDVLAGRTAAEVGKRYDGDLLGADPRASFAAISETAIAAVEGFDVPDRIVHLSTATIRPASTSRISPSSAVCARTTWPGSSARTRPCPRSSCTGCGTRSRRSPRSGASSACWGPR